MLRKPPRAITPQKAVEASGHRKTHTDKKTKIHRHIKSKGPQTPKTTTISNQLVQPVARTNSDFAILANSARSQKVDPLSIPLFARWRKRTLRMAFPEDESIQETIDLIRGFPGIMTFADSPDTLRDALEVWQMKNRFDLIYCKNGKPHLRIHVGKRSAYWINAEHFPSPAKDKPFALVSDMDMMKLDALCIGLRDRLYSVSTVGAYFQSW